jgi:hypothetical protein
LNGYSGFTPASYVEHARALRGFPDVTAYDLLRQLGVTHVVVHLDAYGRRRDDMVAALRGTPWLRIVGQDEAVWVYEVRGAGR